MKSVPILLTGALLSLLTLFLAQNLAQPFYGHHEFNGVFYGLIAKNYLRYGLINTRLAQIITPSNMPPSQWAYHTHHPATYPLLLAAAFKLFGPSEAVARTLSLAAFLSGVVLLILTTQRFLPLPYTLLALMPVLVSPLVRYYSHLPVFEPFIFLGVSGLLHAVLTRRHRRVFIWSLILILIDWPGYWPVLLALLASRIKSNPLRLPTKPLVAALVIGTALILIAQLVSYGQLFTDLFAIGSYRVLTAPFTLSQWLHQLFSRTKAFLGWPLLMFISFGLVLAFKSFTRVGKYLLVGSLLFGLAHIVAFPNITWYHDYMLFHLLPFISLALIFVSAHVCKRYGRGPGIAVITLLTIATYLTTNPFYVALANLTPHLDCYHIAQTHLTGPLTPVIVTSEKASECPPFINYYADRHVPLTVAHQ